MIGIGAFLAFFNALLLGWGVSVWGSGAMATGLVAVALIVPVFCYRHFVQDKGVFPASMYDSGNDSGLRSGPPTKRAGMLPYLALAGEWPPSWWARCSRRPQAERGYSEAQLPTRELAQCVRIAPAVHRPHERAPHHERERQQDEQRERVAGEKEEQREQRGGHAECDGQRTEAQLHPAEPGVLLGVDLGGVPPPTTAAAPDLAVGKIPSLAALAAHRDQRAPQGRLRAFMAG